MGRLSVLALLGLALLAISLHDVQVSAEVVPTESECRPYIEKALNELKGGDADGGDSGETKKDVSGESLVKAPDEGGEGDDTDDSDEAAKPDESGEEHTGDDGDKEVEGAEANEGSEEEGDEEVKEKDHEAEQTGAGQEDSDEEEQTATEHAEEEGEEETSGEEATPAEEDDDDNQEHDARANDDSAETETEGVEDDAEETTTEAAAEGSEEEGEEADVDEHATEDKAEDAPEGVEAKDEGSEEEEGEAKEHGVEDKEEEHEGKEGEEEDEHEGKEGEEDEEHEEKEVEGEEGSEEEGAKAEGSEEGGEEAEEKEADAKAEGSEEEEEEPEGVKKKDEEEDSDEKHDDSDSDDSDSSDSDEEKVVKRTRRDVETAHDDDDDDDDDKHKEVAAEPGVEESGEEEHEKDAHDDDDSKEAGEEHEDASESHKDDDSEEAHPEGHDADDESDEKPAGGEAEEDLSEETAKEEKPSDVKADESEEADTAEKPEEHAEAHEGDHDESEEETRPEDDLLWEGEIPENLRSRRHIDDILHLDSEYNAQETAVDNVAEIILKDLKRIYENAIKPLEVLYKYRDLSNRHFGDPEIFSKPLVLFMGPWSGGKSTIINYLTGNEYTANSLRSGAEPSPAYFNILMYGDEPEVLDGTQLAADWTFSGLQKFGQGLEDRLRGLKMPNKLLEKVNIVEIPGILEVRKQVSRLFPFNDACQWFIDRADIIFLVYDPAKLDVGPETEAILDQLKGREYQTRIILNKADVVKPEELLRVQSALIWNISPLMSSAQPPVMYTTSLWSHPYEPYAPVRLFQAQERSFLRDLRTAIDKRIENKIASARRFAVRVRNHAKMVDCYLNTYYNHKTLFGNKKRIADQIIENPQDYHIYEGLSTLTNISRYDLPDPEVYRDFFRLNPLYDFKKLSQTCTYFRGCPINKLDVAIAYDLPELVGKYKKMAESALAKVEASDHSDKSPEHS